jgi:hypothetical protein
MKKSAIWVFKLLSKEQMEMRVEISETLLRMIIDKGKTFHGSIILQTSWHELAACMYTPEAKLPKQLRNRSISGPTKAKVIASHMKQMIMVYSKPGPRPGVPL